MNTKWEHQTTRFVALQHDFAIRSTDPSISRYLESVLGSLRMPGRPARLYSIVAPAASKEKQFSIYLDEMGLVTVPDAVRAVRHVLWHMNSEAIRTSTDRVLVHAAAAVVGGSAVIMPGTINAGKSTLVAGLALAGYRYLTDELVAIDPATGLVHPYLRPLNLGTDVWPVLPQLAPTAAETQMARACQTWHVDPRRIPGGHIAEPALPRFVVAPQYEDGVRSAIEPLSRSDALRLLFEQTMNADLHGAVAFKTLAALVQSSECVRVVSSTLQSGVQLVRSVTTGPRDRTQSRET